MKNLIRALRPEHWIKNTLVLAAFIFAIGDPSQAEKVGSIWAAALRSLSAAALFCLISSGIYIINDIRDAALDRMHPTKKNRPIASGAIPIGAAWVYGLVLLVAGLAGSYRLSANLACVTGCYVALQISYSFLLKRVALLDVMVIAAGFVLRALAGAVALDVRISPWLLLCTLMLALFLGFSKRKREKIALGAETGENRPSLAMYDERLLDQLIVISASSTIVSYALYTLSPETAVRFGSHALGFTIPFVIFGIFRYLDLVYRHSKGDKPEIVLMTDIPILVDVALFGLTVLFIFFGA